VRKLFWWIVFLEGMERHSCLPTRSI
jgi:hypothetical protein